MPSRRDVPSDPAGGAARSGHGPTRPRRSVSQALLTSKARLRTVVSNAPVVLFAVDRSGLFTLSEGRGLERLGLRPGEVVGRSVFDVYRAVPAIIQSVQRALAGETSTGTAEVGELVYETYYAPIVDQRGRVAGMVGVATDVTERTHAIQLLMDQARRDPLTGVLNHGAITERLQQELQRRDLTAVASVMVDVDGMKAVNDTYGHLSGDAVLKTVATALARDGAIVGRYGGDEYLVILPGAERAAAEAYVEQVAAEIRETKVVDEETSATIRLPVSMGVAVYPREAATFIDLIKASDGAMYAAKSKRVLEEGELSRRLDDRVMGMIADLVPLLTSPGPLEEKLRLVSARLSTGTGYDAVDCQIFLASGTTAESTLRYGQTDELTDGWHEEQRKQQSRAPERAINVILARTRRPVILEDLPSDTRLTEVERALLTQSGLQSAIVAPMLWESRLIGMLGVARRQKAAFDTRDAQFLAAVASQVSAIVRMATLVNGLQRATERLSGAQAETVMMLAAAAEAHDRTTGLHLREYSLSFRGTRTRDGLRQRGCARAGSGSHAPRHRQDQRPGGYPFEPDPL